MPNSPSSSLATLGKQLGIHDLISSAVGFGSVGNLFSNYLATLAVQLGLLGIILTQVRTRAQQVFDYLYSLVFVTVHVTGGAITWIEAYTARDAYVQSQLKHYCMAANDVSTTSAVLPDRSGKRATQSTWVEGGVAYMNIPLQNQQVVVLQASHKIWLVRVHEKLDGAIGGGHSPMAHYFRLTVWAWNRQTISDFIQAAHKAYHEKGNSEIHVFTHANDLSSHQLSQRWIGPIVQTARPWSSVILPPSVKEDLLKDIAEFISDEEKEWYAAHGIPHRRGYLLHGPPGAGKTTLVKALAGKLGMDLYNITPAEPGMDNGKLAKCFRACPRRSILLIEDIDCVMACNRAIDSSATAQRGGGSKRKSKSSRDDRSETKTGYNASQVTLSGLLNAIDGIASQEDSILIASTNYADKLDSALRRPGRFDVHIEFDYATGQQAAEVFKHFYTARPSSSHLDNNTHVHEKGGSAGAAAALVGFASEEELQQAADQFAAMLDDQQIPIATQANGHSEKDQVKVTVAAIQAYLLPHKKDPHAALQHAQAWVDGCRNEGSGNDDAPRAVVPAHMRNGHRWTGVPAGHARIFPEPDDIDDDDGDDSLYLGSGAGVPPDVVEAIFHGLTAGS